MLMVTVQFRFLINHNQIVTKTIDKKNTGFQTLFSQLCNLDDKAGGFKVRGVLDEGYQSESRSNDQRSSCHW